MTKQSKTKVTKAQMVLAIVSRTPECILQDVCEVLDLQSSTSGAILRKLTESGKLTRFHNGTQYVYRVTPGVDVTDVVLPELAPRSEKSDVQKVKTAVVLAKALEEKKLWRRAATVYTNILGMTATANELWHFAQLRSRCLRNARRC
ncbi:PerC family transcriptional regulator [Klebsiella pneumoniae]|uniref:PerC family transcriptional regulator n=1 Tax=Klebsiella pneumoniae complex TaxID=3390273 RepID=UPI0022EC3C24|nr:PerC family transcriptional regulator [Klebsiella quasipneumoniae]MDW8794238.1 PerC family transcriptional regulator [Klebsiella pneumoniae]HBR0964226.1 PerC family transcriptional regulator [Klebsiella quasipneumoniae subsp. similipneumoniae]MDA4071232.1 PerC family transcriptional regulator [Klebsiella quasipneumoniae]HBX4389233.1 PerC family transcriptional regulator [Klebsiella pneumoniae]HCM6690166.1 PerC family transcriptional regulator [Klebsiella pneumoniae]